VTPKAPTGASVLAPPGFHHCTRAVVAFDQEDLRRERVGGELARAGDLAEPWPPAAPLADQGHALE